MALNEKEKTTIKDLQTQEQTCIKKYKKYGQDAKDPVLKELFSTLEKNEQKHYDTLGQILEGKVPECDCNDCEGKEYEPEATYDVMSKSEDKESDAFLATDSIGSEKGPRKCQELVQPYPFTRRLRVTGTVGLRQT